MKTVQRIVLSASLALGLLAAACADDYQNPGIGTSPSGPTTADDDPLPVEPVASDESALKPECTETYDCGTPTAPRTCCRCWYHPECPSGPWDPSCYSGICQR